MNAAVWIVAALLVGGTLYAFSDSLRERWNRRRK